MKPSICLWHDLDLQDTVTIANCETPQHLKLFLEKKFNLEVNTNLRHKILLDLYYYVLVFAKEHDFNEEKTSALFSILKKTQETTIETPYGNMEEVFNFFKDSLACHTVKRPPFCIKLFDISETKLITDYVIRTYFQHFKLYKYAFTSKVTMTLSINYKGLKEEHQPIIEDENKTEEEVEGKTEGKHEQEPEIVIEQKESEEDNAAMKELKKIIRATLDEQISKLKVSMDQKLKANDDVMLKKISETSGREPSPRGGKKASKKK